MAAFIQGVVKAIRPGISPDADHVVVLLHDSGQRLQLFAPADLARELTAGERYEMILRASVYTARDLYPDDVLRYFPTQPAHRCDGIECRVREVGWKARNLAVRFCRPALERGRWLLAQGELGSFILRARVETPPGIDVAPGGFLRFGQARWDLYGVV